jgi:hypothetical protein
MHYLAISILVVHTLAKIYLMFSPQVNPSIRTHCVRRCRLTRGPRRTIRQSSPAPAGAGACPGQLSEATSFGRPCACRVDVSCVFSFASLMHYGQPVRPWTDPSPEIGSKLPTCRSTPTSLPLNRRLRLQSGAASHPPQALTRQRHLPCTFSETRCLSLNPVQVAQSQW